MKKFQKTDLNSLTIRKTLKSLEVELDNAMTQGDEEKAEKLAKRIAEIERAL